MFNVENMIITTSIVIYNEDKNTLKRVIENIGSLKYDIELIIIDNSPINKLKGLCEAYTYVNYIYSDTNLGFGRAHNLAFTYLTLPSAIHLVINPDIYFEIKELEGFIDWFIETQDISLSLPQILNEDATVQNVVRHIPTPIALLKRKLKIDEDEIIVKENTILDIPFAHGCFMAFKRECFQKINGFDENFFLYMEDVDIFVRAKECGRTVINTNYSIYHEHRKGSSKSLKLLMYHLSSAIRFFWKYKYKNHAKISS